MNGAETAIADPYLSLEAVGIVAFAISGAAVAVRAGMDWLGVAVLAVVTSVGGGTLRDMLLGDREIFWVQSPWPVWVAIATAVGVILEAYWHPRRAPDSRRLVLVADAAGLSVFAVTGTVVALSEDASPAVAVLLGVITGCGGGVFRDVLARERPLVLIGQVYALTAAAGATLLVVLDAWGTPAEVSRPSAIALAFALRLLSIRYQWRLPSPPRPQHHPWP